MHAIIIYTGNRTHTIHIYWMYVYADDSDHQKYICVYMMKSGQGKEIGSYADRDEINECKQQAMFTRLKASHIHRHKE